MLPLCDLWIEVLGYVVMVKHEAHVVSVAGQSPHAFAKRGNQVGQTGVQKHVGQYSAFEVVP